MRHLTLYLFLSSIFVLSASCNGNATTKNLDDSAVAMHDTATYSLPMPEMPSDLKTPEERATYAASHYWDSMNWNDTLLLNSERFMGESMANYGVLLNLADKDVAMTSINNMVKAASVSPVAIKTISEYAYDYFYYPEAPQLDAEIYLKFIDSLTASAVLDDSDRQRMKEHRSEILKNRVGSHATDFSYIGTDGSRHTLLSTATDTPIRVLMLYNPDCQACDEAVQIMTGSDGFTHAQKEGQIKVIAINAFGQPTGGPAQRKPSFPAEWTVGYSPSGEVDADEIYVIRTTPTIYLLDSKGTILEKDLSLARLGELVSQK